MTSRALSGTYIGRQPIVLASGRPVWHGCHVTLGAGDEHLARLVIADPKPTAIPKRKRAKVVEGAEDS